MRLHFLIRCRTEAHRYRNLLPIWVTVSNEGYLIARLTPPSLLHTPHEAITPIEFAIDAELSPAKFTHGR